MANVPPMPKVGKRAPPTNLGGYGPRTDEDNGKDDATDGQKTDDDEGMDDGTDGRTEDRRRDGRRHGWADDGRLRRHGQRRDGRLGWTD